MKGLFLSKERRRSTTEVPAKKSAFYRQFVEARAFVNTAANDGIPHRHCEQVSHSAICTTHHINKHSHTTEDERAYPLRTPHEHTQQPQVPA
ncbi:hypothetical protein PHPALM_19556 [Phytophthora palmivora]|uniref:Uncharacterized protein n=1 Tax=Phytophthora palmivora TaxID=4796 RepID=A0A2P4XH39_9STRA|nr:hypothetical protein PHPALM_19556 [Phytophthora palmivora]